MNGVNVKAESPQLLWPADIYKTFKRRGIGTIYQTAGPVFLDIKVSSKRYPMSIRMRDGAHIKNRFRETLLGQKAFD